MEKSTFLIMLAVFLYFQSERTGTLATSCVDRCGLVEPTCGCDDKCLVYMNCCEDFLSQCPDVANVSRDKYDFMSSAEARCSKYNIFVISGCSSDDDSPSLDDTGYLSNFTVFSGLKLPDLMPAGQNFASLDPISQSCWEKALEYHSLIWSRLPEVHGNLETQTSTSSETTPGSRLQEGVVSTIMGLAQAFVSDRTTGFVYANLGVFMCYARHESVPCLWEINARMRAEHPEKDLKSLTLDSIHQMPPTNNLIPADSFSICDPNARDDCDKNSTFYSEKLEEKCRSFTSIVFSTDSFFFNFKNRYCQQCIEGTMYGPQRNIFTKFNLPGFSILLRLSGSYLELGGPNAIENKFRSWRSARCSLDAQGSCEILECHIGLVKRPDGVCKLLMNLHLAIALPDVIVPRIPNQNNYYEKLGRLTRCVAERYGTWDLDRSAKPVFGVIYRIGDRNFAYGTTFTVYESLEEVLNVYQNFYAKYGVALASLLDENETGRSGVEIVDEEVQRSDLLRIYDMYTEKTDDNPLTFRNKFRVDDVEVGPLALFCSCIDKLNASCTLQCVSAKDEVSQLRWRDEMKVLKEGVCLKAYFTSAGEAATLRPCLRVCSMIRAYVIGAFLLTFVDNRL